MNHCLAQMHNGCRLPCLRHRHTHVFVHCWLLALVPIFAPVLVVSHWQPVQWPTFPCTGRHLCAKCLFLQRPHHRWSLNRVCACACLFLCVGGRETKTVEEKCISARHFRRVLVYICTSFCVGKPCLLPDRHVSLAHVFCH